MNFEQFRNYVWGMYGCQTIDLAWELYKKSQHALWMARSLRAKAKVGEYVGEWCLAHRDYESKMETYWNNQQNKWRWVERKCLQKAKEFE